MMSCMSISVEPHNCFGTMNNTLDTWILSTTTRLVPTISLVPWYATQESLGTVQEARVHLEVVG